MITKELAIKLSELNWWKSVSAECIVKFQLYEPRLCMQFQDFHEAVETVLERPVFSHEFAFSDSLRTEFEKKYNFDPKAVQSD
ncbi:hypothetical protein [Methanolapillus millepedarum]|uniref:DUF7736 domain-containing protein n=1 Tax=Methanolapillus millepedarum TaxID=3028296 RepID=A0AA96V6Q2_9EURY|nr:hypothetical protein MsAc7_17360 [Methanosarcinaceae archaeon Ac7]